ncbi:hypothetical protein P875_00109007 [Aspergillus parasiticus SU-1]|uniref:Uncharacterized protein n=1 Tax=Aspergillus parasiticus (strain ATCC 56775 / NRRL 5862 / SRRC 143 / SU-1) TaxID=1403190 RepID=A0A0F0IIU9_ASPPU|nr:hypothetical protein P875_00109007 [Aspergillus parasiticus SU-1]
MARPFQNPYEPVDSPGADNPLSPQPRGGTPISFKTNVNRAKTKRWVEAKKISYDGNDWGDDEYDEYDEDPVPPPPPQQQPLNQSTGDLPGLAARSIPKPWALGMDRSRSMDQVTTLGTGPAPDSRSRSVDRNAEEQDHNLPLRSADIYSRLREQTAGPGSPPSLSRASTDPVPTASPAGREAKGKQSENQSVPSRAQNDVPIIGLPDVRRLSGFGADLTAAPSSDAQKDQPAEPQQQEPQLHHNPSVGFRSVVNQAFDVPETPSTTIDSITRSDSNSTSVISPIIPPRGTNEKTPTIEEEPESTSPPRGFKPGHRRDLSVPSPDNSPLRRPIITNNDTIVPESLAEMSSDLPSDSPQDQSTPTYQQATVQPTTTAAEDRPAPLKISGNMSPPENSIPAIVPSLSTENSPQDTESDRLRKEIIRSLSRENTPSEEPDPQDRSRPQTSRQDSLIPSEYERYWNETASASPQEEFKPVLGYNPAQNKSQDLYSSSPLQTSTPTPNPAPQQDITPKLKRRFSWESASSEEQPVPATNVQSPPVGPIPGQFPVVDENSLQPDPEPEVELEPDTVALPVETHDEAERDRVPEKPRLTIIPPSATDNSSIVSGRYLPEVVNAQTVGDAYSPAVANQDTVTPTPALAPTQSPSIEASLLGFRDILELKTSDERVQAFNKTRDQFVTIDTGLNNWLRVTIHAHPEYADVVQQSLKQTTDESKYPVPRAKFPKLSSLGNLVSSHQEGSSGSGHVRRSSTHLGSMMNKQHVEQRGKDFLHTAGVFGGKAGEAAKGLFAKGRKLALDLAEEGHDKRRTVHFGSLPVMNGVRDSQVNRLSLDIKRKQVPSVSARRPVEGAVADPGYHTDPEPSSVHRHRSGLTQDLDKEVVAALGFSDADSRSGQSGHALSYRSAAGDLAELTASDSAVLAPTESQEHWELPGDSASSAHRLAPVHPGRDCPPRKPLSREKESPPMTPIQVAINDAPLVIPEYKSDQRDIGDKILSWTEQANSMDDPMDEPNNVQPQPASDEPSPEHETTTRAPSSMGKRFYSSVMETKNRDIQRSNGEIKTTTLLDPSHHRRGSSVQVRLQPVPSVSSLGTLEADRDPQRPLRQVLGQANSSRVSFLSDHDGGDGQHQSLGGILRPDHPRRRPKSPWPGDEAEHASRRLSGVFRPLLSGSRPRDASQSTDHAPSNPPAQPASKQAPTQTALSTMEKLKVVGNKIRRPSRGSESHGVKTGQPHRKALDKISGFFNRRAEHARPKSRAAETHVPPVVQIQRQAHSMDRLYPVSSQRTSTSDHSHLPSAEYDRPRSNIENHSFQGQPPPTEGYFAPESFSRLNDPPEPGTPLTQQITVEDVASNTITSNRIPSPTDYFRHRHSGSGSGNGRLTPQSPLFRPPTNPQTPQYQQPPIASPGLTSPLRASPIASPVVPAPQSPPSRGRSEERTYAQDLNIRSRSPKTFAPRPEERHIPSTDTTDPAYHLGIFRQNPRTSRIGDQERPWKLTIPGESEEDKTRDNALAWRQQTTKGVLQCGHDRLPTYEEDTKDPPQENPRDEKPPLSDTPAPTRPSMPPLSQSTGNIHPTRGEGRVLNNDAPVELPVQTDDDSSEEILMSSTAYPGQEWRPVGFSGWE